MGKQGEELLVGAGDEPARVVPKESGPIRAAPAPASSWCSPPRAPSQSIASTTSSNRTARSGAEAYANPIDHVHVGGGEREGVEIGTHRPANVGDVDDARLGRPRRA